MSEHERVNEYEWPIESCPIRLSRADAERFAEILLDPPEPNDALKRAFELHRKMVEPEKGDGNAPQA